MAIGVSLVVADGSTSAVLHRTASPPFAARPRRLRSEKCPITSLGGAHGQRTPTNSNGRYRDDSDRSRRRGPSGPEDRRALDQQWPDAAPTPPPRDRASALSGARLPLARSCER